MVESIVHGVAWNSISGSMERINKTTGIYVSPPSALVQGEDPLL